MVRGCDGHHPVLQFRRIPDLWRRALFGAKLCVAGGDGLYGDAGGEDGSPGAGHPFYL